MICTYFPPPANTKFNPVMKMRALLVKLIKSEPLIVVLNLTNTTQLVLSQDKIPTNEQEFKKFFAITTDMHAAMNKQHIIISCKLLSEHTMNKIKFDKSKPQFLEWLDNEKVFIEADLLGVYKTMTIGYLTKLHLQLTNRTGLKKLLQIALEDVLIAPELAAELDPSLKNAVQMAKANGDFFNPEIPPFEVYKTRLTHGRDKKDKVSTKAIGIKSAAPQARLVREFFSQLASPVHYEKQIGVFVPTGTAHLLGVDHYKKIIRDNNQFIDSVVTILVGDFQHATLDLPFSIDTTMDIKQTTLQELISDLDWCIRVDKATNDMKVIITTTKPQLEQARKWIDNTLPSLYKQHIADKIDVTMLKHLILRRLDRPILTAAATAYADKLKHQTAISAPSAMTTQQFTKPPCAKKPAS